MVCSKGKIWLIFRSAVAWITLLFMFTFSRVEKMSAASIYYIAANGADLNNGTSKTTPWLHMPGMPTCSSICAAYNPLPGDQIILRGGDSWTNTNFPILWTWSGSSATPLYVGVDMTWYSGSSWIRPVFNAGGIAITGSANDFIQLKNVTYVTVDNIEMTGIYWSGLGTYGGIGAITTFGSDYITLENLYIHNWTHATGGSTTDSNAMMVIGQTSPPYCGHCLLTNSIIENADGGGDSGYATYAWGGSITNSIFHDLPNAILEMDAGSAQISGNLIYNITTSFGGTHENAIETLGGTTGTLYIYNNVIHDLALGESLMMGNTGETDYVWNNLFYNISNTVGPRFPQNTGQTGMSLYFWNNTIVTGTSSNCITWSSGHGGSFNIVVIENNHCITTGGLNDAGFAATTLTVDHNVLQTPTAATNQGYTSSETYVYAPTAPTNSTVGSGTPICGVEETCTANYAALASDTTYACTQQSVNGVIVSVCPTRTVVAHPSSGAWDAGAYQSPAPAAPSGLTGVIR
jgi:hypothetical protein